MKRIIDIDESLYNRVKEKIVALSDIPVLCKAVDDSTPYNPTGDCISREVINSEIEKRYCSKHCVVPSEEPYCPDNCPARFLKNIVKECPTVPQVTVFTESTDEKAVADLKAELQSVIEARPQGSWETDNIGIYCSVCKKHLDVETPFCPLCGADMRKGGAE